MSRLSRYTALALFTAVIASSGAYAATTHQHHHAAPIAGAHNGPSEDDTRRQCAEDRPEVRDDLRRHRPQAEDQRIAVAIRPDAEVNAGAFDRRRKPIAPGTRGSETPIGGPRNNSLRRDGIGLWPPQRAIMADLRRLRGDDGRRGPDLARKGR